MPRRELESTAPCTAGIGTGQAARPQSCLRVCQGSAACPPAGMTSARRIGQLADVPGAHAAHAGRVAGPQGASISKRKDRMRYAEVITRATRVEVDEGGGFSSTWARAWPMAGEVSDEAHPRPKTKEPGRAPLAGGPPARPARPRHCPRQGTRPHRQLQEDDQEMMVTIGRPLGGPCGTRPARFEKPTTSRCTCGNASGEAAGRRRRHNRPLSSVPSLHGNRLAGSYLPDQDQRADARETRRDLPCHACRSLASAELAGCRACAHHSAGRRHTAAVTRRRDTGAARMPLRLLHTAIISGGHAGLQQGVAQTASTKKSRFACVSAAPGPRMRCRWRRSRRIGYRGTARERRPCCCGIVRHLLCLCAMMLGLPAPGEATRSAG